MVRACFRCRIRQAEIKEGAIFMKIVVLKSSGNTHGSGFVSSETGVETGTASVDCVSVESVSVNASETVGAMMT